MNTFSQNLAHFAHGMALMFFIFASLQLYLYKERNRLLTYLMLELFFWAILQLKDIGYLIDGVWENELITNINLSIDMWFVPITMVFLFELISPKWVTIRKLLFLVIPSVLFTIAYLIYPNDLLFKISILYANILGLITMLLVYLASTRYDNYVKRNFSFTENINLSWLRATIIVLISTLFIWTFIVWFTTWLGDALYYFFTIIVWMFIYYYSLKHVIIDVPNFLDFFRNKNKEEGEEENFTVVEEDYPFVIRLKEFMEQEHLFMDPNLAIADLALLIGTNRTYLSRYLNTELHTNFYEYVNGYRLRMACHLLLSETNKSIDEIVKQCGFNSRSTFHKRFINEMGETPTQFLKRHKIQ